MIISLRAGLRNDDMALAPLALGISANVAVFGGDAVDDAAVGSVDARHMRIARSADFFDPAARFFGDFVLALLFVVRDIDDDVRQSRALVVQRCRDDILQTAQSFGAAPNQNAIQIAAFDR